VKENDFTMVYGFPGRTQQFLTSDAVNLIGNMEDPAMVDIRDKKLEIIAAAMKDNPLLKIQYAAKYVNIANAWKKWMGESKGLKKIGTIEKKKKSEEEFNRWVQSDETRKTKYGNLLSTFSEVYKQYTPIALANDYFNEAGIGVEIIKYAYGFKNIITKSNDKLVKDDEILKMVEQSKAAAKGYFKNYDLNTDKKIFIALMKIYFEKNNAKFQPDIYKNVILAKFNGDIEKYAGFIYENSSFTSEEKVLKMLNKFKRKNAKKIASDPAFILATSLYSNYINQIYPYHSAYNDILDSLYRVYVTGIRELKTDKKFYPDANLTLRLTYGKVASYKPNDAVKYNYFTTLDGIMEKEDAEIEDYKVPAKLKELYKQKDYGIYGKDGVMPVAFIATNHTSGGNSGSPVLNAEGQIIGVNFDRVWEGTMSDIMFDTTQCRNISLDIRYALFIIDKYAGAKRLIEEMRIVE